MVLMLGIYFIYRLFYPARSNKVLIAIGLMIAQYYIVAVIVGFVFKQVSNYPCFFWSERSLCSNTTF
jgi:hypothetical protein